MKLRTIFRGGLLLRTIARELRALRAEQHTQTLVLQRFADTLLPPVDDRVPAADGQRLAHDTGVSFLDPLELGLVEDYRAKTLKDTGREPTEDEILTWLADEKTVDLHARLVARQRELIERPRPSAP